MSVSSEAMKRVRGLKVRSSGRLVSVGSLLLLVIASTAAAQTQRPPGQQPQPGELRTLRGQIFLPYGTTPDRALRFSFSSSDGLVNQVHFTDSNGRFVIPNLSIYTTYIITVEADGVSYETTTQVVQVSVTNYLVIFLKPKRSEPNTPPGLVAAAGADVPQKAKEAYEKGLNSIQHNRLEAAMTWMKRAVELHPTYLEAYNELGVLQMRLGQLSEATASFRRAIEINDRFYLPFLNLGIALCKQEQFSEAASALATAIQLDPNSAPAHFYLGVALMGTGKYFEAEKELKEAYRSGRRGMAAALLFLGNLYYEQQNYEKAIEAFEQYLKDLPKASNAREVRAAIERARAASAFSRRVR